MLRTSAASGALSGGLLGASHDKSEEPAPGSAKQGVSGLLPDKSPGCECEPCVPMLTTNFIL